MAMLNYHNMKYEETFRSYPVPVSSQDVNAYFENRKELSNLSQVHVASNDLQDLARKSNMDIYKTFIYEVRKLSFVDPFLKLQGDVTPMLRNYIKLLDNVRFEDGLYHKYYGDVKKIVNSFITCWAKTMDEAYKVADKYTHFITRDKLLELMETTIDLNQTNQIDFGRDFLPVKSQLEEEIYKEVEENFDNLMERLYQLQSDIERLDKQEKVDAFAKEHFPISLKKKNELNRIHISLEEIVLRVRNNLMCLQEQCTSSINSLLNQLYDKNKEQLNIFRQDTRSSIEIAEVQRSMEILKDKIEDSKYKPVSRLVDEYKYWQDRLNEFKQIVDAFKKLSEEEKNIHEQERIFLKIRCPFNFGPKGECWLETEKIIQDNRRAVKEMQTNAAKALMSFISVRGQNHVIYSDKVGPYFVDQYGHQVYFFDFGLNVFHVDCDGQFFEADESEKYYYDAMGRFVVDADQSKLYKMGTCTSSYRIQGDVFEKQTTDCGHSLRTMHGCKLRIRDPNDVTFLPLMEDIDLSESMDPDTSKYLWASFGHILPLALRDVATAQPRNPIHYLAHKLLYHKFSRSNGELKSMKEEAEKYRVKVFQDRKDAAIAASKAWKAKQVKRRKPEESDDAAERLAYDAHLASQQFVRDLNYFYD